MRVLGIDPGLLHTGWSIIERQGNERKYIASGVILPKRTLPLPERLAVIFNGISEICDRFKPDACSIEIIFVNENPKTTLLLGHARAAAMVAASTHGIEIFECEPNTIKKALTGGGHADKSAVDRMARILLPAANPKTPDESDAIAIALTHTNMSNFLK